jgi:hypothetical protein
MAWLEDVFGGLGSNVLLGVGLTLAAPVALPTAGVLLQPLAKGLMHGYFALAELIQNRVGEVEHRPHKTAKHASARMNARHPAAAKRRNGITSHKDSHHGQSNGRQHTKGGTKKTNAAHAT